MGRRGIPAAFFKMTFWAVMAASWQGEINHGSLGFHGWEKSVSVLGGMKRVVFGKPATAGVAVALTGVFGKSAGLHFKIGGRRSEFE